MATVSGVPAYLQIAADLRQQISTGALPPGSRLPSSAQLQQLYDVSNTVIRAALRELHRDGLTVGQQGKGVFVADGTATSSRSNDVVMERLDELTAIVRQLDERIARIEKGASRSR
jgi:GntR family transcriptional regulator